MQSRTDGVHCRESAGTEPVNLKKVASITGAALAGHHGPMRLFFPHPLLVFVVVFSTLLSDRASNDPVIYVQVAWPRLPIIRYVVCWTGKGSEGHLQSSNESMHGVGMLKIPAKYNIWSHR